MINKAFAYIKVDDNTEPFDVIVNSIRDFCLDNNISLFDNYIFIDKSIGGKQIKMDTPQALTNLSLNPGDTFIIKELNQLGNNLETIKNVWKSLYMQGVDIIVIDNPIFSTYNKSLIEKKLKSDILIELLNYIDQNMDIIHKERLIKQNSTIGRPKEDIDTLTDEQLKLLKENFEKFDKDRGERSITADQFMNILGLKRNTFYKIIKQYKKMLNDN